jgi:hypothetical protein
MTSTTVSSNFGYFPQYSGVGESGLLPLYWNPVKIKTSSLTAGGSPLTLTTAQVSGGLVCLDPEGAMSATMPTAAELWKALGSKTGQSAVVWVKNEADAAETITVVAGSGLTMQGTLTIAQNNVRGFLIVLESETASTAYNLGTRVA